MPSHRNPLQHTHIRYIHRHTHTHTLSVRAAVCVLVIVCVRVSLLLLISSSNMASVCHCFQKSQHVVDVTGELRCGIFIPAWGPVQCRAGFVPHVAPMSYSGCGCTKQTDRSGSSEVLVLSAFSHEEEL